MHPPEAMNENSVRSLNVPDVEREELEVDVLLVGAGPANLSCAIHLQRLLAERGVEDKMILDSELSGILPLLNLNGQGGER